MTVFQAKHGLRFICLAMPMHLHDRAGKLASILYSIVSLGLLYEALCYL